MAFKSLYGFFKVNLLKLLGCVKCRELEYTRMSKKKLFILTDIVRKVVDRFEKTDYI